MRDGQYVVRRAAYRGLANLDPSSFARVSTTWADTAEVELRQRAAEAWAWLPCGDVSAAAADKLYEKLAADPQRTVRAAADSAWRDRRNRVWAAQYLDRIRSIQRGGNEAILTNWRYGEALSRVGDDSSLWALQEALADPKLPSHSRYWLQRVIGGLEQQWIKAQKEWPGPWRRWEGSLLLEA